MTEAPDLRDALATAKAPCVTDESLPRMLASADNAAEDLAISLDVAAKVNDPDTRREVAVEAIIAAEGLEAAAEALEAHLHTLRRAAKGLVGGFRRSLAADMSAAKVRWVEGSSHRATLEAGSLRVVIADDADLPEDYMVTTRKPDIAKIARALAAGETIPGAKREPGPPRVRITLLRETELQRTT